MSSLSKLTVGQSVQTRFGKGIVRQVRNGGRLLVEVRDRTFEVPERQVTELPARRRRSPPNRSVGSHPSRDLTSPTGAPVEVDFHGLTVEEALARAERALNDALLADAGSLRLIHGRRGGRIRSALHTWLRGLSVARHVQIDPTNEGVTIVRL